MAAKHRVSRKPNERRHWFGESTATLIAAIIGLLAAVVSVAVPLLFRGEPEVVLPSGYYSSDGRDIQYSPPGPEFKLAREAAAMEAAAAELDSKSHDLTLGVWTLVDSVDDQGTVWNNSTLKFTSQTATDAGIELEGFFEWRSFDQTVGREFVKANYNAATEQLFIEGQRTDQPGRLGIGSFAAQVSPDGRQLLHGTWGSTPGNLASVPGSWNARR